MADRQAHPVGDTAYGQLVQVSKPLPTNPRYVGSHDSITVANAVVDLNAPPDAIHAFITIETAAIRFWLDGQDPSATVGHVAESGTVLELETISEVHQFRTIRRDGVSSVISVSYGYA